MKTNILLCIAVLVLAGCNHIYREYDKKSFSSYSWEDGRKIEFRPEISDVAKVYQIRIGIRHHVGLNVPESGIHVTIKSPSGQSMEHDIKFRFKDSMGKNIGDCAGDLCDLEELVIDDHKFNETGVHTIILSHNEKGYRIPGILEVGVIIDEKKE